MNSTLTVYTQQASPKGKISRGADYNVQELIIKANDRFWKIVLDKGIPQVQALESLDDDMQAFLNRIGDE